MNKIIVLLVTVAALQVAYAELRDQRLAKKRYDTATDFLSKTIAETDKIVDKDDVREAQSAADDIAKKTSAAIDHLNFGIKGNTRNNQAGKQLYTISRQGDELEAWMKSNLLHADATKVVANIKTGAEKYSKLINDVSVAYTNLKESTDNFEKGVNELTHFIDVALASAQKLYYNLKFRKYTNAELRKNIIDILEQDLAFLEKIRTQSNAVNELQFHSIQLRYLAINIKHRLAQWLESPKTKPLEQKVAVEKVLAEVTKIEDDITRMNNGADPSLETLKSSFKLWLTQIVKAVTSIQSTSDNLERVSLFDAFGVVTKFHPLFENLSRA